DREDRDRDRRLHDLADLEPRVGGRDREKDAEQEAPGDRAHRDLGRGGGGGDDRRVALAGGQGLISVLRQRLLVGRVHPSSLCQKSAASLLRTSGGCSPAPQGTTP